MIRRAGLLFRKVIVKICCAFNCRFIKKFQVSKKTNFQFYVRKEDPLSLRIYEKGIRDFENEPIQYLLKKIRGQFGVFLDIGSFTGIYAILACRANPAIRAVALEPNKLILPLLHKNLRINKIQANVLPYFLNKEKVVKKLYIPKSDPSCASMNPYQANLWRGKGTVTNISVRGSGIGFLKNKKIAGIKIDVEGAELEALLILKKNIIETSPFVIIESSNQKNAEKIYLFFKKLGYQSVKFKQQGALSEASSKHMTHIFEKQRSTEKKSDSLKHKK